jgi:hypothetical protein
LGGGEVGGHEERFYLIGKRSKKARKSRAHSCQKTARNYQLQVFKSFKKCLMIARAFNRMIGSRYPASTYNFHRRLPLEFVKEILGNIRLLAL